MPASLTVLTIRSWFFALFILGAAGAGAKDAGDYVGDAKDYVLAPLHWDQTDWAWFAGSIATVAVAHHFDNSVRDHFGPQPFDSRDPHNLRDIVPVAALGGAVLVQGLLGDKPALNLSFGMMEAAVLAGGTTFALKFATGRQRPNETLNSNQWFKSGDGFPSMHTSVAFAAATVFAERDADNIIARRIVAYGLATGTAYLRLKDNQHWLSDTVAGAAIGISTGMYVSHRGHGLNHTASNWSIAPIGGGVGIAYTHELR